MFPWAYNAERGRWCEGLRWQRYIGISPKATRDWAATYLRSKDTNEMVIGKLFGHIPKTVTGRYGSVDMETMRRALEQLNWIPPKSPIKGLKITDSAYQEDTYKGPQRCTQRS